MDKTVAEGKGVIIDSLPFPPPSSEAKKVRKENEERKAALVDALQRKCKVLLELEEKMKAVQPQGGEEGSGVAGSGVKGSGAVTQAEGTGNSDTVAQAEGKTDVADEGDDSDGFKLAFAELRKWWV